ncbi:MAG: phosphate ABC transporter ATP-binding protein [Phycisphaeraceae bacterium]|nr:phosphate ABC transporter ATP-binding protein [Phycisphaeraceae bacterium]
MPPSKFAQPPPPEAPPEAPPESPPEATSPPEVNSPPQGAAAQPPALPGGTSSSLATSLHVGHVVTDADPKPPVIYETLRHEDNVLEIEKFNLWYGPKQALFDVTMGVPRGKVTALIGPSGCGKSTLLRSVNRINDLIDHVRIDGEMKLLGQSIYARDVDVIQLRKRMGMVFQKPNPFPMSIFENVVYSLRIDGERRRGVLAQVCEESLRSAALWDEVKDRLTESALSLSGGQQQRLCIARAIAAEPEILLMDEPCSALDPIATGRIEDLIASLKGDYTILMVTHNMQQASRSSDYTVFMYLGNLIEYGPTIHIFTNPRLRQTEDYITGRFG